VHLEWTKFAIKDLADARDFIVLSNPQAASRMSERVKEVAEYLLEYPNIG
jgi:plasmid stabilization system protein ParE